MNLDKKIRESITWNTLESLIYQVLLCTHQLMLYKFGGPIHYGIVGTIFAVVYLTSTALIGGFDQSLTPMFGELRRNRILFRQVVLFDLLKQVGIIIAIGAIAYSTIFGMGYFEKFSLSWPMLILIGGTALSEGIRKVFRTILQFFFRARMVAGVELGLLTFYCSSVWVGYFYLNDLPLWLIFLPLLLTSATALTVYGFILVAEYRSMPTTDSTEPEAIRHRFTKSRIINAINTVGHLVCSGNFLVPLFSLIKGLEVAGLFKLISYWSQIITPSVQRIFGTSSQALFAEIKKRPAHEKRVFFFWFNSYLMKVLATIFASLFITVVTVYWFNIVDLNTIPWLLIGLFVTLLLSENIVIVYEKFCIAEEKGSYLLMSQLFSFSMWLIGARSGLLSEPTLILIWLLITRLMSCWLLATLVNKALSPANVIKNTFAPIKQ